MSNTNLYERNVKLLEELTSTEPINTINGKCSRCGFCCTHHLPLFSGEIKRIKKYVKDHNIKPCTKFEPPKEHPEGYVLDLTCPFLDTSGSQSRCTIYEVRPWICKSYLCSERTNAKRMDDILKKEIATGNVSPQDIMDSKEYNTQQTFFPKEYTPKPGEPVTINGLYAKAMVKYNNQVFIYTGQTRKNNDVTEVLLLSITGPLWFDINGLAVVHNLI